MVFKNKLITFIKTTIMNTKNVHLKLGAYSAMAASFMLTHNDAEAQIIYTDIIPDRSLITAGPYDTLHLDVDGDLTTDFVFNVSFSYSSYGSADNFNHIGIQGLMGDRIAYTFASTNIYTNFSSYLVASPSADLAKQINLASPIGPTLNFKNVAELFNQECFNAPYSSVGDYCWTVGLPLNTTKYIGFRLKMGPLKYYGWMRVAVKNIPGVYPVPTSVFIYDYAINWTPNTPINAGAGLVCLNPYPIGTAAVAPHWAKVVWEPIVDVENYEVQYRAPGAAWELKIVPPGKSSVRLNGLACNTSYDWQVRSACDDGSLSEFSEIQNFTTADCRLEDEDITNSEPVDIFINATSLHVNFETPLETAANLVVYNMLGQFIMKAELTTQDNIINLDLPSGMYAVNVVSANGGSSKLITVTK